MTWIGLDEHAAEASGLLQDQGLRSSHTIHASHFECNATLSLPEEGVERIVSFTIVRVIHETLRMARSRATFVGKAVTRRLDHWPRM